MAAKDDRIFDILDEIREKVTYTNGKVARAIKDIEENKKDISNIKSKMYTFMWALWVISIFSWKIVETLTK